MRNCDTMTTISENIKDLMRLHGITQSELAERADMKQPAISRLLNSEDANPTILTLQSIANVFGVDVEDLVRKNRKKVAC